MVHWSFHFTESNSRYARELSVKCVLAHPGGLNIPERVDNWSARDAPKGTQMTAQGSLQTADRDQGMPDSTPVRVIENSCRPVAIEPLLSGYARWVGRVGGLAVALGVGAAIASMPTAFAHSDGSGGSGDSGSGGSSSAGPARAAHGGSSAGSSTRTARSRNQAPSSLRNSSVAAPAASSSGSGARSSSSQSTHPQSAPDEISPSASSRHSARVARGTSVSATVPRASSAASAAAQAPARTAAPQLATGFTVAPAASTVGGNQASSTASSDGEPYCGFHPDFCWERHRRQPQRRDPAR